MEKIPESKVKIRFIDCDPLGHLTNSRYVDYMLNAREDHVNEAYNLDYFEYSKTTGNAWVAYQNQITYLREVSFNEQVIISSKIIEIQESEGIIEILMMDNEKKQVKAVLWTTIVHMNLFKRKRENHSDEIYEMLQQVLVPIEQKTYQDRVNYLKNNNKNGNS